ncbi:MAG: outer-membrane lipoprotein carrier protein LolA [Proteobacteria bacterium]|nr:outer-membrane lipoprotein carrier protein LolA [Pseudomonadota bacterium]
MRILLAAFATLVAFVLTTGAQAQQKGGIAEVETYINSIRTLQARFVQSNPNGSNVQGTLYVSRPGKMRFQYDPPSQLKIVADGRQVTMWDPVNKDFGQWPIGWTAASFLVKEPFKLSGDITVEANQRTPDGLLALTLVQTRKPQEGKVIVRLSENPMQLRGWTVIDNRGNKVDVSLTNVQTGIQLADSLFKYDGPDAGQILRGGNRN